MDPVSLTASIIAIIQISGTVVSICYDYRNAIKNSAEDAIKIIKEIKSLQDVLERLLQLVERDEAKEYPRLASLHGLNQLEGTLTLCRSELSSLKIKLEAPHGIKKILKINKLPLTEKEVKTTLDSISQMKGTLCLAIATDQMSTLVSIEESMHALKLAQNEVILDNNRSKIHAWLHAPDPSSTHASARSKVHAGTGNWLLQHESYKAWKSNSAKFMWLHGIPGCGKTVLCSTVIEDLKKYCQAREKSVCSYFYLDSTDVHGRDEQFLRSILVQVSEQYPDTPPSLNQLYRERGWGSQQPTQLALLAALKAMLESLDDVFIVMDALDEARVREDVLATLSHIHGWSLQNVNLFVTSRRESDLVTGLSPIVSNEIAVDTKAVDHDICCYVRTRLIEDPKLKRWPDSVRGDIEKSLMCDTQGMFRWAVCQLDQLRKCIKLPALQTTLKSLPKTLHETYEWIIAGIDREHSRDTLHVLQWLAFSARPVRLEEIVEVLAVDWERKQGPQFDSGLRLLDPVDLLTVCSSLITLEKHSIDDNDAVLQSTTTVKLAHASVKDFLMSDSIGESRVGAYALDPTASHAVITHTTLLYLLQFETVPTSDTVSLFPLLTYAARYWPHHFRALGKSPSHDLLELVLTLLTSKNVPYSAWCTLYNPDTPWKHDLFSMRDNISSSPLYYTSLLGLEELSRRLIAAGYHPNMPGGLLETPLLAAVHSGHDEIAHALLEAGADHTLREAGATFADHRSTPPLIVAARNGLERTVQVLLFKGANPNHLDLDEGTPLSCAAGNGNGRIIQMLLEAGSDPNMWHRKTRKGIPLVAAAEKGFEAVTKQLLPGATQFAIERALRVAASKGHENIVRLLIGTGIDHDIALSCAARVGAQDLVSELLAVNLTIEQKSRLSKHPLGIPDSVLTAAVQGGHEALVQALLSEKRQPDAYTEALLSEKKQPVAYTLNCAVQQGHLGMLKTLLESCDFEESALSHNLMDAAIDGYTSIALSLLHSGANIEYSDEWRGRPLHVSAHEGHFGLVKVLLDSGAEINSTGGMKGSAIQASAYRGDFNMVKYLLEKGADIDLHGDGKLNALQLSAMKGHKIIAEFLLEKGASLTSGGGEGNALYHAILGEQQEIAKMLLERGANPNISEINNDVELETGKLPTPLIRAVLQDSIDLVNLLVTHGADVNASAKYWGVTHLPLQTAAARGDLEIIRTLHALGANINAVTEDGWTASHCAARDGQHDALRVLIVDYQADKDMCLANGSSVLHLAAANGYSKCVDVCLETGLEVDTQNNDGMTALHWAVDKSHQAAVETLVKSGASVEIPDRNALTPVDYAACNLEKQEGNKSSQDTLKSLEALQRKRRKLM